MSEVRFIRKNGRIIPIRDKKKERGAKQLAGAAVFGGLGGLAAGIKVRKAENMSQATFDFMEDKPHSKLPKGVKDIHDGFMKANRKLRFSKKIAFGARLGSTALAFAGINNLLHNEEDSDLKSGVKLAGAAVASELVSRGIYAGFRKRNPFRLPISPAVKKTGMKLINDIMKKVAL